MSNSIGASSKFAEQLLNQLRDMQTEARSLQTSTGKSDDKQQSGMSFMDHLKQSVQEVNQASKTADAMATELAVGKSGNIHETMLAATKAELQFNLMVQLRNKALEAYTEVMRMPV